MNELMKNVNQILKLRNEIDEIETFIQICKEKDSKLSFAKKKIKFKVRAYRNFEVEAYFNLPKEMISPIKKQAEELLGVKMKELKSYLNEDK